MKSELIHEIYHLMQPHLSPDQNRILETVLNQVFDTCNLPDCSIDTPAVDSRQNKKLIQLFIAAKKSRDVLTTRLITTIIRFPAWTKRSRKTSAISRPMICAFICPIIRIRGIPVKLRLITSDESCPLFLPGWRMKIIL